MLLCVQGNILLNEILVGLCPVSLLAGFFLMIDFGFATTAYILLIVFLEDPTSEGGYGFNSVQAACCKHAKSTKRPPLTSHSYICLVDWISCGRSLWTCRKRSPTTLVLPQSRWTVETRISSLLLVGSSYHFGDRSWALWRSFAVSCTFHGIGFGCVLHLVRGNVYCSCHDDLPLRDVRGPCT